jgi:hypothetical protein
VTTLAVWQSVITDDAGNIKPGAAVRVTLAGLSTLATLKPNRDGSGSLGNPFTADADGFARFYVAQGRYDIRVTFAGAQRDHVNVCLFADTSLNFTAPVYQLVTPAAGSTNNYSPAGFTSSVTVLDVDLGAGDATLTGLVPTDGWANGQDVIIRNKHASNSLTLVAESASSTAANRFALPFDLTLTPGGSVRGKYISTIARLLLCP